MADEREERSRTKVLAMIPGGQEAIWDADGLLDCLAERFGSVRQATMDLGAHMPHVIAVWDTAYTAGRASGFEDAQRED